MTFGQNGGLVGTLCLPRSLPDSGPAVGQILFNAGILHRIGPHRLNVRLARRLARRGIPSIRFDLSGLGDSDRAGARQSFDEQAVTDLRSAMDVLGREAGLAHFALLGFCSGGRHGYATAVVDSRVAGLFLYDTFTFATVRSRWNRYRLRIRRHGLRGAVLGWARLRAARLLGAGRLFGSGVPGPLPNPSGYVNFRVPTKEEYAQRIRMLHAKGVKIGVLFSGESENHNYRAQFDDAFRGMGVVEHMNYDYMPEMDHTVMLLSWQTEFVRRIETWTVALDEELRRKAGVPSLDGSSG